MPESSPAPTAYKVLARKYRPQTFSDLIGQDAMVRTLRNAFKNNRIAHAFMLTGVRGVGKTTTARILARALNYLPTDGEDAGPVFDMDAEGAHCRAIAESRHPDVMEMDAASRTGIGDIRELIEGVRYAPVAARYKIYIIDEVHMLSTAAFNGLLKTLEEPPPHVKFIFATTEIRKVPVTVLSRCQRFDLRRIDPDVMKAHLASVLKQEDAQIDEDALALIVRAAEGSVRDALSLLDQAIALTEDGVALGADAVRNMLGLADQSRVFDLLESVLGGDAAAALDEFRAQYDMGADPAQIVRDMMELAHGLARRKASGSDSLIGAPQDLRTRFDALSDALSISALTRAWSLLSGGLGEVQGAPDAAAAFEMLLIRMAYAADLPDPEELMKKISGDRLESSRAAPGGPARLKPSGAPAAQAANGEKIAAGSLKDLADIAKLAGARRDIHLKKELETWLGLVSFDPPHLEVKPKPGAPGDLANRLAQRLSEWTDARWIVTVSTRSDASPSLREQRDAELREDPLVKSVLAEFPGARIVAVRDLTEATATASFDGDAENGPYTDQAESNSNKS
ncbi:MAG: DNA polymerase III subunit gamma/tau [Parvularculaceae bacterium]